MRLHIITIGVPKLAYAQAGWQEYIQRLKHYHTLQVTHLADKYAADTKHILRTAGSAYTVALVITGKQFSSATLAEFLTKRSLESREVCFIIGGPEGLPLAVTDQADVQWSISQLTFPHDLAMVVLSEALYRASTITAGHPYHRA